MQLRYSGEIELLATLCFSIFQWWDFRVCFVALP